MRSRITAAALGLLLLTSACSETDQPTNVSAQSPTNPIEEFNAAAVEPGDVPDPLAEGDLAERELKADVNIALHSVPLSDIVFDTFDGGSISLPEATEDEIRGLLNAIPPIDDPVYVSGVDAAWLDPDDLVLGFVAGDGTAWAYPHRVMNFHEIVNTTLGSQPVAITYCPLCGSGLVFDRRPNDLRHDGALTFDNTSALYENDMVMVDAETHTYWWQVDGAGIVGNLTGTELTLLPSMTAAWSSWLELHPDTQVLSNDQGSGPRYEFDPFEGYATRLDAGRTSFPTSPEAFADERLLPSTRIIGFDVDGTPAAVAVLANEPVAVPISGADAVVFLDGAGGGGLYSAAVDGQTASFTWDGNSFVDSVTGSGWNAAGRATSGPTTGDQLRALPSRSAFWFAWVSTLDGVPTRIFSPAGAR